MKKISEKFLIYAINRWRSNNKYTKILFPFINLIEKNEYTSKVLRELYEKRYGIKIGIYSYGGCFNHANIRQNTIFGKFCSIASGVCVYNRDHPKSFISTHPMLFNSKIGFIEKGTIPFNEKIIGNDVWIGKNAIILASVKRIGNGAIIGAGAVVTKDVPDYAIVAGVPAKIISFRFSPEEIEWLLKIKWWDWPINQIFEALPYMNNIEKFKEFVNNIRKKN